MQSYQQRLFWAAGCTIIAVLLGGWLLPKQPASSMGGDWFWSNKVRPSRQFEVVAVGDSRIYRGFSPNDFAATYAPDRAVTVFNFGFSSAGLDTAFLVAAAKLVDTTAPLPVILVGITTSSLADENAANQHFWQEDQRSTLSIWQRKYINPQLTFFDPTSPNTLLNHWQGARQGYYQQHYANGWIASDKEPHNLWESYEHVKRTYPHVAFSLGLRWRLLQQIAAWQAQGIQVVAFRPPAAPHLEAVEMLPEYYPEEAIKAQIQAVGGIWIDLPNTQQYQTYDGNHLIEASARQWSADIGQALRQALQKKAKQTTIWQKQEDFETLQLPNLIQDTTAPKGAQIQALAAKSYSHTFLHHLDQLPLDSVALNTSVWVRFIDTVASEEVLLVISVENAAGMQLWQGQPVAKQILDPSEWTKIQLKVPYVHRDAGALLKVYVWNNTTQTVLLDHLTIEIASL
ncbi:MAG: hypothetical protein AB8E82_10080 [Aureispira sp.]